MHTTARYATSGQQERRDVEINSRLEKFYLPLSFVYKVLILISFAFLKQ